MGLIAEFKEFVSRGSVVDLAVGVVIGAAFGKIVTAMVDGIVMPVISMVTGGVSVADWKHVITPAQLDATGKQVAAEVAIKYGMSGNFYLGGALVLGAVFLWYAWRLLDPPDEFFAMKTFQYSVVYLMALFAFLLLDHWLLPWLQPVPALELQPVG